MKITSEMIETALCEQNERRSPFEKDKFIVDGRCAKYTYGAWIDLFDLAARLNDAMAEAERELDDVS